MISYANFDSVSIVTLRNNFVVSDNNKIIFRGNTKIPQHKTFLTNVQKTISPAQAKAA